MSEPAPRPTTRANTNFPLSKEKSDQTHSLYLILTSFRKTQLNNKMQTPRFIARQINRLFRNQPHKPDQPPNSIDTMKLRRDIIELSILNLSICTRGERQAISSGKKPGLSADSLIGDYAEFGVYHGASFIHACKIGESLFPEMRYFAFDSFEGLPKIAEIDAGGEFHEGQFACTKEKFTENIVASGVDLQKVIIHEGWYDTSLNQAFCHSSKLSTISLAFIDCDLYQSCVPVLNFLTPLLRQGSILLFDDWYNFRSDPQRGVQRATLEWLRSNKEFELINWMPFCHHGQGFIVKLNHHY